MELAALEVLVVDCQATAARGALLELGWGRPGSATKARLIRLPDGARVPPAVARITGITDRLLREGVEPARAWAELAHEATALPRQPAPTVVHFARFEQPYLDAAQVGLDVVCTHELARRLFPELPRRSLRALAGYFGHAVTALRRSAEHVEATALVWRGMLPLLAELGVDTWPGLKAFLAEPVDPKRRARKAWPMPRELRLALPDAPGLYRMLRTSGDVLYVGKATSLHHRVNSYFRKQHGVHERTLEMLSQARGLSFEVTASALEAALLEPDEIKRHRPPYNVALTVDERSVWFADPALARSSPHRTKACTVGPFPRGELLEQLSSFAAGLPAALGRGRWAPLPGVFAEGLSRLVAAQGELASTARIVRLGARLWGEGRRDRDDDEREEQPREWTPELVANGLERLALRSALALRRARWLTRLVESSLVWSEIETGTGRASGHPGRSRGIHFVRSDPELRGGPSTPLGTNGRLLVISSGEIVTRAPAVAQQPPIPPGYARSPEQRHAGFTVARLDRLRVLTTELKRLVSEQHPVALRLGPAALFSGQRLARILEWL